MKEKMSGAVFVWIGLAIVLVSPFMPDFLMNIVKSDASIFDYRYAEMRLTEIIPSVRTGGIVLAVWGFILKWNEKKL